MNPQELSEYLGRLLGRPIAVDSLVKLSSGQQARVAGWLTERGIAAEFLRESLASSFQPAALLRDESGVPKPAATVAAVNTSSGGGPAGVRIGIDIQRIDELFGPEDAFDPKASAELKAIFTLREISYAQSRPGPLDTLAGLFAAKEALRKCDATLLSRSLAELEVLPDAAGRPDFPGFSLSISHSGGFAIAVAAAAEQQQPRVLASVPAPGAAPAEGPRAAGRGGRARTVAITAALAIALVVIGAFGKFHTLCSCR